MNTDMRIISIAGGKGGVGKTTIALNLSMAMAKLQKRTLLFDADLSLANIDILLGLRTEKNISDVLSGSRNISEICIQYKPYLNIIPATSGGQNLADLSTYQLADLIDAFSSIKDPTEVMIADIASGISSQVLNLTNASQDIVVVLCNDPASIADGYAMIKVLHQKHARKRFGIIINKCKSAYESEDVFLRFQIMVAGYLDVQLEYIGHVPVDDYILLASQDKCTVVEAYPSSKSAKAFTAIAAAVLSWPIDGQGGGIQYFMERLVQCDAYD